jgi:hypothetical protein
MGKSCLRAVLDHPALELVGLYVYDPAKEGQDAGAIARRAPTGILATRDRDAILALEADVALHCARLAPPYGAHDPDLCALLASGKNVISINGYTDPAHWTGPRAETLAAACAQGRSSLAGVGLNPGFAVEQIAAVASGVSSEIARIAVDESVDCRAVRSPAYVFDVLGFGADPAGIDPNDPSFGPAAALNGMYEETLAALAAHLGGRLVDVATEHRVFGASEDLVVSAGPISKGRVAHVNWRWRGRMERGPELIVAIHWHMETANLPEPEPPLWRVRIEGRPNVRVAIDLDRPDSWEARTSAEQLGLASAVVNAIPSVCAAPSGLILRPLATPFDVGYARAPSFLA